MQWRARPPTRPAVRKPDDDVYLASDETTKLINAGQTRAVSEVVERTDLPPRGKGEGSKMRYQDVEAEGMLLSCDIQS